MKIEMVRRVDWVAGGEIGADRGCEHDRFAQEQRALEEHRAQNHPQKKQVGQAFKPPDIVWFRQPGPDRPGRPQIIPIIDRVEHGQQHRQARAPHGPAMFRHPPKRNPLKVTQEQRRIPDRRQAAAHIRHDENEKDHVMRGDAIFVHAQPGADEQHGRAGRAEQIGQERADQQEHDVCQGRGLAFQADVNAAGDDEQRGDQDDETDVFACGVPDAIVCLEADQVVQQRHGAERIRRLRIMFLPPVGQKQRRQSDTGEQDHERQNHPGVGMDGMFHAIGKLGERTSFSFTAMM